MSLSSLPTEILREIGRKIPSLSTLRALCCVNRDFYTIFDQLLYQADGRCHLGAAIAWAAEHRVMETLQKAFSHGAQISSAGEVSTGEAGIIYGKSTSGQVSNCSPPNPLCLAVQNGHVDITELFLEKGCNVDMRDPEGFSLLCLAVIHDHPHLVRALLSRGARQDRRQLRARHSPIQIAVSKGAKEIVLLLLHYGPDFARPTAVQLQKAIACALREGHKHILPPLLDTGISFNFQFQDCRAASAYTPLLWAVEEGDIQLLNLLLEGDKADPNYCTGDEDQIPLLKAALKNHEKIARILVGRTSRLHRTRALALSMDHGDGQIAQVLLENGTLPDFKDGDHTASTEEFNCNLGCVHDPLIPPIIRAVCRGHTNLV